jgi:hypothetical protein
MIGVSLRSTLQFHTLTSNFQLGLQEGSNAAEIASSDSRVSSDAGDIGVGGAGTRAGSEPARATGGAIQVGEDGFRHGVPYTDKTILTSKYENGTVHGPNAALTEARKRVFGHFSTTQSEGQTTHLFPKGDKVYPTKIDVNVDKDTVAMSIVACDTCNKTDPPTYNKAQVVFQFPKGSLGKANAGEVEDTIGQLLAISDDSQQAQGGDQQGGQQQGGQQQGGQPQQQQAPQQPQEPQTIQMGMTTDQVKAAMGTPEKIVNLGPKQIYVYKDLKVTFLGGKVADVQ